MIPCMKNNVGSYQRSTYGTKKRKINAHMKFKDYSINNTSISHPPVSNMNKETGKDRVA